MFSSLFRRRTASPSVALATRAATLSPFAPAVPASTTVSPPVRRQGGGFTWSLETIRAARDAQLRGQFEQPVRLAEAFRTNDAMFTAYQARVATQSAIKLLWRPADTDTGRDLSVLAERSILTPQHTRESILGTLANHGIAIGYVLHDVVDDPARGPVVRMTLTEWPLEHVRYNASTCTLETRTRDNGTATITHGDGRWIVFRKFGVAPWTQDACVLPGALVWAAHGGCLSDWAGASFSHGQPKVIGTLREGVSLGNGTDGTLTPEAQAVLNVIAALVSGDAGAGVLPFGADAKLLYNGSTAWQVFKELGLDRGKAAMRIYLGTDAALGSQGGAPGVDIAALLNVASSRVQGDLEALERGYREGIIEPWARLQGFAAADLPSLTYAMPDTDGDKRSAQEASAVERLAVMAKAMKDSGLRVEQTEIDALVSVLGITVPCTLAATETKAIPLQLAPADIARVVKVREARAAQGLPPLGDERDDLTISALDAQSQAPAATPGEAPDPAAAAPAPTNDSLVPFTRARSADEDEDDDGDKIDADGDGFYDEEDEDEIAEDAIRGGVTDGDGDGLLDEAEIDLLGEVRVTQNRVKNALAKRQIAREQATKLEAQRRKIQPEILPAVQAHEELRAEHETKFGDAHIDEKRGLLDDDSPEAKKRLDSLEREERRSERKVDAAALKAQRLQTKHERLLDRIETLDAGSSEPLKRAVDAHVDAKQDFNIAIGDSLSDTFDDEGVEQLRFPPGSPEHAKRTKFATETNEEMDSLREIVGTWPERNKSNPHRAEYDERAERDGRQKGDAEAHAIVTGPNGGRYYLTPSGEKEYVD